MANKISINVLPVDCLSIIFSYLDIESRLTTEKVCSKWKEASKLTWSDVKILDFTDINFLQKQFSRSKVTKASMVFINKAILIKRCGRFLTNFQWPLYLDDKVLSSIKKNCENLTKFGIRVSTSNNDTIVGEIIANNQKLQSVEINYGIMVEPKMKITTFHAEFIPLGIQSITLLSSVSDFVAKSLWDYQSLVQNFMLELSTSFAASLDKLNSLRVLKIDHFKIDGTVLEAIASKETITDLSLTQCVFEITREPIKLNSLNLKYLDLHGSYFHENNYPFIMDSFMLEIIKNCKQLEHLDLSKTSDIVPYTLFQLGMLKNLKKLYLNEVESCDDIVVSQLRNLEVLEIRGCCVSDDGITGIIENCLNIEKLDVREMRAFDVTADVLLHALEVTRSRKKRLNILIDEDISEEFYDIVGCSGKYLIINRG